MTEMVRVSLGELEARCVAALVFAGASPEQASALAQATVQAELHGHPKVGVAHLLDYLDGFRCGRISAGSGPVVSTRSSVIVEVDCGGGLAQHGFAAARGSLTRSAAEHGVGVAAIHHCFTAGELGFYARELAAQGLVALAFANSPALVAVADSRGPLVGTNPMAFGVPAPDGRRPMVFDQAASASAFVAVREAAAKGDALAPGIAVDGAGRPTTSAAAALQGALLPFGGYKGGNLAILVELLAVLAGGMFSCEAPAFDVGSESPAMGLLIVGLSPAFFAPDFIHRVHDQLWHWRDAHGAQVDRRPADPLGDHVQVPQELLAQLQTAAHTDEQGASTC